MINNNTKERIAKRIANLGHCSRRKAEELIAGNKVLVNNQKVTTPAFFVSKEDIITVEGKVLSNQQRNTKLYMYYKPKGLICSYKDEEDRKTIFDDLKRYEKLPRLLYIGRLDYSSEGLLLLTNNGELSNILSSPKLELARVYKVRVFGKVDQNQLDKLSFGLIIENIKYKPVIANILSKKGNNTWVEFTLKEGKNREIRKICELLGLQVSRLIRTSFANYELENLQEGELVEINISSLHRIIGEKSYQEIVKGF